MGKYFTVDVKPTITASKQHTAAFTAGDVLFDWTEVQIPKGTSKVIGAAALVRPKGNAAVTANPFGIFMLFSKTNTQTLGTINTAPTTVPTNDLLGLLEIEDTNSYPPSQLKSTTIGMAGRASNTSTQANVLITPSQTGDNVGYDKFYVAGMANGAFDFTSILVVSDADIASAAHTSIVTAGTSMDNRKHFIADDVIHAQDDAVVGTLASVAESGITLTSELGTSVLTNGDTLYNINPIRIILFFEQ